MEKPTYRIETSEDGFQFDFESVSESKTIKKSVRFYPLEADSTIYELVFGDVSVDGSIDVKTMSNNQDMVKVISTVISTMYYFFELNSEKSVAFMGSSPSRNRLYRVIISKLIDKNPNSFDIFGWNYAGTIETFTKNKDYFAFEIKLKHEKEI